MLSLGFFTPTKQTHQPKTKIRKEKKYRNPKWSKRRNNRVNDLLSPSHNGKWKLHVCQTELKSQTQFPMLLLLPKLPSPHYINLQWRHHGSLSGIVFFFRNGICQTLSTLSISLSGRLLCQRILIRTRKRRKSTNPLTLLTPFKESIKS